MMIMMMIMMLTSYENEMDTARIKDELLDVTL
jgi:hypothetical protein